MAKTLNITLPTTREDVKVIANTTLNKVTNLVSQLKPDNTRAQLEATNARDLATMDRLANCLTTAYDENVKLRALLKLHNITVDF